MSSLLRLIRPGQIFVKNNTYASFAQITHVHPDYKNNTAQVGIGKILENEDSQTEIIPEDEIYNNYTFVFDLFEFLEAWMIDHPDYRPSQEPRKLRVHDLFVKLDDHRIFAKIIAANEGDNCFYQPILPGSMPRRVLLKKDDVNRYFGFIVNLIDVLKFFRQKISEEQARQKVIILK